MELSGFRRDPRTGEWATRGGPTAEGKFYCFLIVIHRALRLAARYQSLCSRGYISVGSHGPSFECCSVLDTLKAYAGQRWCPEEHASILSRVFFFYVNALMHTGSQKHLEQDDLWDLSDDHKTSGLYKKYKAAMEETATAKHPYVRSVLLLPSLLLCVDQ